MARKIKIFDYCWHIAHQWDQVNALRDYCEFYYCINVKRSWDISVRPLPSQIKFVPYYEPGIYDVAILHIDQSVIDPMSQKRMIFDHFNSVIQDIPKIILNHGTPVYPEYFKSKGMGVTHREAQRECIRIVREITGDNTMVVNSYTAAGNREWGFGHPIVHGMKPEEWMDLPKEPRVFTSLSPFGFGAYYNRAGMVEVADVLYEKYGYILQYAKRNINVSRTPDEYKRHLGKSLIYIDTSIRTPMNRARTEAFLSGCCVIQVEGAHDLDRWAEDRNNIVIVPNDPDEIANTVFYYLEEGFDQAIEIGQNGKKMAMEMFSYERYRNDWLRLLEQTGIKNE